jgi:hypothetical protein
MEWTLAVLCITFILFYGLVYLFWSPASKQYKKDRKKEVSNETDYYVCRTHSHTDRQQLWKVMSRPFRHKEDAEAWKEYVASFEKNKEHKFFIIQREREDRC